MIGRYYKAVEEDDGVNEKENKRTGCQRNSCWKRFYFQCWIRKGDA